MRLKSHVQSINLHANDVTRCTSAKHAEFYKIKASENMVISPCTGKEVSQTSLSGATTHVRQTGHPISFHDFSILCSDNSQINVLLRESLLIAKINPSLNANMRYIFPHHFIHVPHLFFPCTTFVFPVLRYLS